MRALIVLFSAVALTGCFFPKAGPAPGPLNALALQTAQGRWADSTPESLEKGRQFFLGACDNCHKYPDMPYYAEEKWPKIMERMGPKAELSKEETELVLRFILAARTQPATPQQ